MRLAAGRQRGRGYGSKRVGQSGERGCTGSCSKLVFSGLDFQAGVSERVDRSKAAECASFAAVTALMFCIRSRLLVGPLRPNKVWASAPALFSRLVFVVAKTPVHCSKSSPDRHFVQDAPYQGLKPNSLSIFTATSRALIQNKTQHPKHILGSAAGVPGLRSEDLGHPSMVADG
jgi:hypothetical protein